jgi:hypothetical protein
MRLYEARDNLGTTAAGGRRADVAGRPRTRAKREAERAGKRAKRVDAITRRRILERGEALGNLALAAREAGVNENTARSWRERNCAQPSQTLPQHIAEGDSVATLRAQAAAARSSQAEAEHQADVQIGLGRASEGRNCRVCASMAADGARELEDAARVQELHQAGITEQQGRAIYSTAEALLAALRLPFGRSSRRVLAVLLQSAAEGHAPSLDAVQPYVQQARDEVRERIRAELRDELPEPEPDAEPAPVEDTPALEPTPAEIEPDEAPPAGVVRARPAGHRLPSGVTIYDPAPVTRTVTPARTQPVPPAPSRWSLR